MSELFYNSNGIPVAGLADGTDGELITWDASGVAATVAVGTSGQVLTSNGAGAAPTFQSGSSPAFTTTSNVTSNSPGTLGTDDFVFGSDQLDDDADTSHDDRFIFDKSKGFFGAGRFTGTQVDASNRGNLAAFVLGRDSTASGASAFALGFNNTATSANAVAIGQSNNATTGGSNVAIGSFCDATGSEAAFAFGQGANTSAAKAMCINTDGDVELTNSVTRSILVGIDSDEGTLRIRAHPTGGSGTRGSVEVMGYLDTQAVSPAQITSDQNNYDPDEQSFLRLSTDASRTITGFADGADGRHLYIANVGSNDLVLANQSASSSAANRIITSTGANITIAADDSAILIYDDTTSRWRGFRVPAAAASGDVVGPGSSVDNQIVTFDGTTGKLIQDASTVALTVSAGDNVFSSSDEISLTSTATSTDAIDINSSGGIDIDATGNNISLATTGAANRVVINSSGTGSNAFDVNNASGGASFTLGHDFGVTTSRDIALISNRNDETAIRILSNSGGIQMRATPDTTSHDLEIEHVTDQAFSGALMDFKSNCTNASGTGAQVRIQANASAGTCGSIDIRTTPAVSGSGGDISITTGTNTGATPGNILIDANNTGVSSFTVDCEGTASMVSEGTFTTTSNSASADAIRLNAASGGIDFTASSNIDFNDSTVINLTNDRRASATSFTTAGDTINAITSTAAARTVTLATADVHEGKIIYVKDESGGAATNNITVDTQGSETIDGNSTGTISANYGVLRLYSDGTNWFTL